MLELQRRPTHTHIHILEDFSQQEVSIRLCIEQTLLCSSHAADTAWKRTVNVHYPSHRVHWKYRQMTKQLPIRRDDALMMMLYIYIYKTINGITCYDTIITIWGFMNESVSYFLTKSLPQGLEIHSYFIYSRRLAQECASLVAWELPQGRYRVGGMCWESLGASW